MTTKTSALENISIGTSIKVVSSVTPKGALTVTALETNPGARGPIEVIVAKSARGSLFEVFRQPGSECWSVFRISTGRFATVFSAKSV